MGGGRDDDETAAPSFPSVPGIRMSERQVITESSAPSFSAHVRFRFNKPRDQWVILAPERLLVPDEPSVEILKLLDGKMTVGAIVDALAEKYNAPHEVIAKDVTELLQGLADKGFVVT
jgi:pyrroloquinoline quinone biosynthesis protein D